MDRDTQEEFEDRLIELLREYGLDGYAEALLDVLEGAFDDIQEWFSGDSYYDE